MSVYARLNPRHHALEIDILGPAVELESPVAVTGRLEPKAPGEAPRFEPVVFARLSELGGRLPALALAYASQGGLDVDLVRFEILARGLPFGARLVELIDEAGTVQPIRAGLAGDLMLFWDSPDEGRPECLCSRCGQRIDDRAIRAIFDAGPLLEARVHADCIPEAPARARQHASTQEARPW